MKLNIINIVRAKFKIKIEFIFLSLLILITFISLNFYNFQRQILTEEWVSLINNTYLKKSVDFTFSQQQPRYLEKKHVIKKGENLKNILLNYDVPEIEVNNIIIALSKKIKLKNLKSNQEIKFLYDRKENVIKEFTYPITKSKQIYLVKDKITDNFLISEVITNLNRRLLFKEGIIKQSLYKSATNLDIKPNIIVQFANIFGFQVDFQRDIRKNDTFQILYEILEDEKGKFFGTGKIIFANLNLSGQENSFYKFEYGDNVDYFDKSGKDHCR